MMIKDTKELQMIRILCAAAVFGWGISFYNAKQPNMLELQIFEDDLIVASNIVPVIQPITQAELDGKPEPLTRQELRQLIKDVGENYAR